MIDQRTQAGGHISFLRVNDVNIRCYKDEFCQNWDQSPCLESITDNEVRQDGNAFAPKGEALVERA